MNIQTFNFLCKSLGPLVASQVTRFSEPISVDKKVAITLYKLIHGCPSTILMHMFAVGESTIYDILCCVEPTIIRCLGNRILWPFGERLRRITIEF